MFLKPLNRQNREIPGIYLFPVKLRPAAGHVDTVIEVSKYRVALNFCGSLTLRMSDFLCFAGTNFCDWEKLVFLAKN